MTPELTALKKVRGRRDERVAKNEESAKEEDPSDLGLALEHHYDGEIIGLTFAMEQFQSDLRATLTRLKEIEARVRADYENNPIAYRFQTLELVQALISAIDSALVEEAK